MKSRLVVTMLSLLAVALSVPFGLAATCPVECQEGITLYLASVDPDPDSASLQCGYDPWRGSNSIDHRASSFGDVRVDWRGLIGGSRCLGYMSVDGAVNEYVNSSFSPPTDQDACARLFADQFATLTGQPCVMLDPVLTLVVTATPSTYDSIGEVITYQYDVSSDGTAPIAGPNLTVTDDTVAVVDCPPFTTVGNNDNWLDPGESLTCTGTHTVVQADLIEGFITNTATASTTLGVTSNPDGETVTSVYEPQPIPTLSEWGLLLLGALLAGFGALHIRKKLPT